MVAKLGIGRSPRLRLEMEVARQLVAHGAPVVAPAGEVPARVHSCAGLDVTFWRYHSQEGVPDIDPGEVAAALRPLHGALASISSPLRASLPSYVRELESARGLLTNAAALPSLPEADRRMLLATFDVLGASLSELAPPASHVVLHGSPHGYNVLRVRGEPRFIDFETTCTGPVEWDLAFVEASAGSRYGLPLAGRLLRICRAMASVMTAAFCWSDVGRGDLREHAMWHLEHVRTNVAPLLSESRATG